MMSLLILLCQISLVLLLLVTKCSPNFLPIAPVIKPTPIQTTSDLSFIHVDTAQLHCVLPTQRLVTIVMLYFEECDALRYHVIKWSSLSSSLLRMFSFLVVDDHSSLSAAQCLSTLLPQRGHDIELNIVRINERKEWNIGGGRNVGSFVSCAPFLLICDMDGYVSTAVLNTSLELVKNGSLGMDESVEDSKLAVYPSLYLWNRLIRRDPLVFQHHPAIMLVSRHLYWQVQGCDEDFVGHYGKTDVHFRYRAKGYYNVSLNIIPSPLLCRLSVFDKAPEQFSLNEAQGSKAALPTHVVLNKSAVFNAKLFKMKLAHKVVWNDTILRFSWQLEHLPPYTMSLDNISSNKSVLMDFSSLVSSYQSKAFVTEFWDVGNSTSSNNSSAVFFFPPTCQ